MSRLLMYEGLLLLPYIPIGFLILILRLCIFSQAFLASFVLSPFPTLRNYVLRVMCTLLGWIVFVKKSKLSSTQLTLPIVSNHVTLFDHLVICLTKPCVTPHSRVFHWYSSFVPLDDLSVAELVGRRIQKNDEPVHLFPEQTPSDRPHHLLTFDHSMLDLLDKIQPVGLNVTRVFPIKLVTYPIWPYMELFWQFFTPFTIYHVEYLEPIGRQPKENVKDFTERIRYRIADAVNASLSESSAQELTEGDIVAQDNSIWASSQSIASTNPSTPSLSPRSSISMRSPSISSIQESGLVRSRRPRNHETTEDEDNKFSDMVYDHLIPVVQTVLNHVPVDEIRKALCEVGGDVDNAIYNLVAHQEECNPEVQTPTATDSSCLPVSRMNTAAKTFHSSSFARESSLRERRQMLLMHGRKHFAKQSLAPSNS